MFIYIVIFILLMICIGLPFKIDRTQYKISSNKINDEIKIVLMSDLHNANYGKNMHKIVDIVRKENPDAILMPGDMCEEHAEQNRTFELLNELKEWHCYLSTGNHDEYRPDLEQLKQKIRETGTIVLDNKTSVLKIKHTSLEIVGIPCLLKEEEFDVNDINALFKTDYYRILLSHRPHWVRLYSQCNCDMVVTGHAHGGQWRIPFTKQGLIAPGQGIFPKYTDGIHVINGRKLIISRGLVRHYHGIPRLFNNPEIVIIHLIPE